LCRNRGAGHGKQDPSLEDTVNGILKFMYRKGIISIAAREVDSVPPICATEVNVSASAD
jgi:hypothetical protein